MDKWRLKQQELELEGLPDAGPEKVRSTSVPLWPDGTKAFLSSLSYTHSCIWGLYPAYFWEWLNPGTVPPRGLQDYLMEIGNNAVALHPTKADAAALYFVRVAARELVGRTAVPASRVVKGGG